MFLFYAGFGDEDLFCFWILFWYFYSMFYSVFISLIYFRIYFCMQWEGESESEVAQLCPTLCNPVDCSPPDFSVHGILQARILEWVAVSFSRGSSQPRDRTQVSCIAGRRFNLWAARRENYFPQTNNKLHQLLNSLPFLTVYSISIFYEIFTSPWVCFQDAPGLHWSMWLLVCQTTPLIK